MAKKQSAGTLLYRRAADGIDVLLVHPSGNYNRRAPWSIPKGLPNDDESLEEAARRETREETGIEAGELTELGFIDYVKSRKRVFAFAGPMPGHDPVGLPLLAAEARLEEAEPRCASWEVDRAELVPVARAAELLHPDQLPFLARLAELLHQLGANGSGPVAGSTPIP